MLTAYQQIMVIPQGSINIVVQEVVPSRNYIGENLQD